MWVDFSHDATKLASASVDGTCRIWSILTLLKDIRTVTTEINSTKDTKHMYISAYDHDTIQDDSNAAIHEIIQEHVSFWLLVESFYYLVYTKENSYDDHFIIEFLLFF